MCGRYFFHLEDHPSFAKLKQKIDQMKLFEYASEEVFPSQQAIVMIEDGNDYQVSKMKWGIQSYKKTLLINARIEGIETKKTFVPLLHNRCLIPCNGFYEWITIKEKKRKVYIQKKDTPLLYLAGIYDDDGEFVIITGESTNQMKEVHHRTPILIQEEEIPHYFQGRFSFNVDNENLIFQQQ